MKAWTCALCLSWSVAQVSVAEPGRLDTGFLRARPEPTPDAKPADGARTGAQGGNRSKRIALEEKKAEQISLSQAAETVNSLTLIIKKTGKGPARNKLLLNHATALNLYARLKIIASKNSADAEKVKQYLRVSIKDTDEVLASKDRTPDQVLKAHDIAGTSYLYLDEPKKARARFLEVLKLNPPDDKAGRLGLMVAEDLFDEGKFREAAGFYSKYYPQMTPALKELALYKLGWCMMNLDQHDQAEQYLARVAKSQSISGVGKDAIRDLAYLVTHRPNAMAAIDKTEAFFTTLEDKLAFLHNVRINLESQNAIEPHSVIVARLMQSEPDPEKQLELALANLRVQRKLYASIEHMQAFDKTAERVRKLSQKLFSALFPKYESAIENELQSLMKSFVDTFAARVKTPEPITRAQIADSMKRQFRFYHQYFSAKPNYPLVITMWGDICLDMKDWLCVDEVSQIVLAKPDRLAQFQERAMIDQIGALQELTQGENALKGAELEELKKRKDLRVREFAEKFPKSAQWLRVAKLYSQMEIDAGNYAGAVPTLAKILEREPSADAFYRLQYARFKLEQHEVLLSDPRNRAYVKTDPKIAELVRETSLILAQKAKSDGKTDHYRTYISDFIALSTDPSKARIARADFLAFLLENKRVDEALREYFALPSTDAKHAELDAVRSGIWKAAVENGKLDAALKVAQVDASTPEWRQRRILSGFFLGQLPTADDLRALQDSERDYFLGTIALVRPGWVIAHFKARKSSLTAAERELLALSYRFEKGEWKLTRTKELEQALGRDYPFSVAPSFKEIPLERDIERIQFPDLKKLKPAAQAKTVQDNMEKTRNARNRLTQAIQDKPPEVQARVAERAAKLEDRMAHYLVTSPLPEGLTAEQVNEYRKGLESAAEEFRKQSEQFALLHAKLKEQVEKNTRYAESRLLPAPNMEEWPWPSSTSKHDQIQWVNAAYRKGNLLGALSLLDYFRLKHLDNEDEFFAIRSGILLSQKGSQALRIYILEELEKNKQSGLVEKWAKITDRPVPETL